MEKKKKSDQGVTNRAPMGMIVPFYAVLVLYNPGEGETGSSQRFHCNIRLVSSVLKVFISAWGENSEVLGLRHLK